MAKMTILAPDYKPQVLSIKWKSVSHVWLFATPWTIQSMEFSRPEYWSGRFSLLQRIFPIQRLNPGLPHCSWILHQLSHKGSPSILEYIAYPFSSRSSWPKNWTGVSCIAVAFFTNWAIREVLSKLRFYSFSSLTYLSGVLSTCR